MFSPSRPSFTLASFLLTLIVALAPLGGCRGGDPSPTKDLRERFPVESAQILDGGEGFLVTEQGFARSPGVERGLDVELPRAGADVIRFRSAGAEVRVREVGATGEATLVEGVVAYRCTGGTSFWAATPGGGVEEWLLLDAGIAERGRPVASWEIEGARPRSKGDSIEIVDAAGVVQLRVTAPAAYAASGRRVEVRLEARGSAIELSVDAGGDAVLVDPAWMAAGSMVMSRREHTATRLASGQVLVAGGRGAAGFNAGVELYNPVANTWTTKAPMIGARTGLTATRLANDTVLVVGGTTVSPLKTVELYDPATNTWMAKAPMSVARAYHTATLLPDGKVLVVGGTGATALASVEVYDPALDTWTTKASMINGRFYHTATLLGGSTVLVTGGRGAAATATVEAYDVASDTWTLKTPLSNAREYHTATLLGDGTVLVVGGRNGAALASVELYTPAADTWTAKAPLATARYASSATRLQSGRVMAAGGFGTAFLTSVEVYDATSDTWAPLAPLLTTRDLHTATLLSTGDVLVVGGFNGTYLASAERYLFSSQSTLCTLATDCLSGFCADGVCCDTACNAGPCDACSIAAGAAADGICAQLTGSACDDGDACTQTDSCLTGTCIGGSPVTCAALTQCHTPGVCNTGTGVCSTPTKADGSACSDGDACTQTDSCQAGACAGNNPVTCVAPEQCHTPGVCNTGTGVCSTPTKADGSACSDGDACTQTDSCQAGACAGSTPVICTAQDACHAAGICHPGTGVCSNPNLPLGTICVTAACVGSTLIKADFCDGNGACVDQGTQSCAPTMCTNLACAAPCMTDQECGPTNYCNAGVCAGKQATSAACAGANQCASGFCADGICCDSACSKGACDACAVALGASADGTCTLVTGPVCDDGDACTQSDTCQAGACVGGSQVVCTMPDPCHTAGICDPVLGLCINPEKPDNTPCTGGLCNAGTCVADGDGDKIPDADDICPKMYNSDQADQDGDKIGDVCDNDLDGDGKPNASDNCPTIPNGNQDDANSDGVGDACICAPPKQNGDPCDDGNLCTLNDTCVKEGCTTTLPLKCPLPGQVLGVCETSTCIPDVGGCSVFNKVDGAPCQQNSEMGACIAGGCLVATTSGVGGSGGEPGTGGGINMSTSGSTGNGSGGAGAMSSASTSAAPNGGEAGVGGSEEIRLHGGCSVSRGPESQGPASSAPWLLLGALLAAFTRASRHRTRACSRF